jgi:hypothetical protein
MNRYKMTWAIDSKFNEGGNLMDPGLDQVMEKLASIAFCPGSVTLRRFDGPVIGPQCLQVLGENRQYLITLGEEDEDDYNVRAFTNKAAVNGKVLILGDFWDKRMICTDFQLVVDVFKEFFRTGDVSRDILS